MQKTPDNNGDRRFSHEEFITEKRLRCGFGGYYPKWLQPLLDVRAFVACFGVLALVSWSLYTALVSQITTIEKAFGFSSSESGSLMTLWEVGYLLSSLFANYFAYKAHKPRVIGVVTCLNAVTGVIITLPHFFAFSAPQLQADAGGTGGTTSITDPASSILCRNTSVSYSGNTTEQAVSEGVATSKKSLAYAVFVIGLVVQGVVRAPAYPYSSAYVDDVDKRSTGFYMGLIWSVGIFGLAAGYGLGSYVSTQYVTLEDVDMTPIDPRWIGAWWLGFIIVACATFVVALPMFCFPRNLTGVQQIVHNRRKPEGNAVLLEFKDMVATLLDVLSTPLFMLIVLGATVQALAMYTFIAFEPKYMETQFAIPSWKSNIILSVSSILSLSVGCGVGGYLTKRLNPAPVRCLQIILLMKLVVIALLVVTMFLGCPHQDIHNPYTDNSELSEAQCDCSGHEFLPICGGDGITYFSPCHAGCTNGTLSSFSDCSRIPGGGAVSGLCSTGCNMVWPYAVVKFLQGFTDAAASMFMFIGFIRTVSEKEKALALGISAVVSSLLAGMPGPVIGGRVIDSTCLIWNTAETAAQYCALYNIEWLRYRAHGLMIGIRVAGIVLIGVALLKARGSVKWKNEEDEEKHAQELVKMSE